MSSYKEKRMTRDGFQFSQLHDIRARIETLEKKTRDSEGDIREMRKILEDKQRLLKIYNMTCLYGFQRLNQSIQEFQNILSQVSKMEKKIQNSIHICKMLLIFDWNLNITFK